VTLLYGPFLTSLGVRIEHDFAAVMNSASFAGSGQEEDGDTHYQDSFSVLEVSRAEQSGWVGGWIFDY
jgi:hypothetical protein